MCLCVCAYVFLFSLHSTICYLYSIYFNKITVHCFPWYCHRIHVVVGFFFSFVNWLYVCLYVLGEQFSGLNLSSYFFSVLSLLVAVVVVVAAVAFVNFFFSPHFLASAIYFWKLHFIYICFNFAVWPGLHWHTYTHTDSLNQIIIRLCWRGTKIQYRDEKTKFKLDIFFLLNLCWRTFFGLFVRLFCRIKKIQPWT